MKHRRSSAAGWPRAHRTFCHNTPVLPGIWPIYPFVAKHRLPLACRGDSSKYVRSGGDWCKLAAFLVQAFLAPPHGPTLSFSRRE